MRKQAPTRSPQLLGNPEPLSTFTRKVKSGQAGRVHLGVGSGFVYMSSPGFSWALGPHLEVILGLVCASFPQCIITAALPGTFLCPINRIIVHLGWVDMPTDLKREGTQLGGMSLHHEQDVSSRFQR